ncbi:MAG: putative glycosyltransferase, partial [Solirubrobacterales bacterium]|nr:putative glycosyltransferase [Solirubrobacterales bacterium]
MTVVVVSWNTAALLDRCLDALRADHDSGLATVVVVDNGSTDGSPQLVAARHPWVTLVCPHQPANIGYGPAVNLAAAHRDAAARPRWLVAANADVAVHPGALQALVDAGDADPGVGIVAPRLLLPDGSTQHHVHPFPSLGALAALHVPGGARVLPAGRVMEGRWDPECPGDVDWAHGAFLLVRRGPFDAIGGFAAGQWLYAEDVDLCWRLAGAGWRTRYTPTARVTHAVSAATTQAWTDDGAREQRKQAATYAWMRASYGPRRTAL